MLSGMGKSKQKLTPVPTRSRAVPQGKDRPQAAPGAQSAAAPDLSHIHPSLHALAVRTADLAFLADNPLDHDDREIEEMRAVLQARGQLLPIVVNRRPTPPVVLGGNKRLRAMLAEGHEWAAVVNVDLADDDAAALAVELNATQGVLWNKDRLLKALNRVGKLTLGEVRDRLMTRLAEAQKLIPKDPPASQPPAADQTGELSAGFRVLIECADEAAQLELIERLSGEGLTCRALTS